MFRGVNGRPVLDSSDLITINFPVLFVAVLAADPSLIYRSPYRPIHLKY